METGIDTWIRAQFGMEKTDADTYSPLVLAYIGDCIYELVIRTLTVAKGNRQVNKMNRATSRLVKAQAQAKMMETLHPLLTEKEADIYRRGRNAKSSTIAKNASVADYRKATGFEALMGYLYLTDELPRLLELVKAALDHYTPDEREGAEARNSGRTPSEKDS